MALRGTSVSLTYIDSNAKILPSLVRYPYGFRVYCIIHSLFTCAIQPIQRIQPIQLIQLNAGYRGKRILIYITSCNSSTILLLTNLPLIFSGLIGRIGRMPARPANASSLVPLFSSTGWILSPSPYPIALPDCPSSTYQSRRL